jgi:hypothetical protein
MPVASGPVGERMSVLTRLLLASLLVLVGLPLRPSAGQDPPAQPGTPPTPAQAPAGEQAEPVAHLGAVERVSVYPRTQRVVVAGEVQLRRSQAVELIACARGGKTHESIFLLKCRPSDLNAALIVIGCKYESGPRFFQDPTKPVGTRVIAEVEWMVEGVPVRHRVEDLAWDARVGRPMPRIAWVYVGSKFAADPVTGEEVFVADRERNLITTLHDPFSLLDNPLTSGGDVTPGRYVSNPQVVPPQGTPITVTIRRATEAEIAASRETEAAEEKADAAWRAEQAARAEREAKGTPDAPGDPDGGGK